MYRSMLASSVNCGRASMISLDMNRSTAPVGLIHCEEEDRGEM